MELAVKQNTKNKFGHYFTPKVVADFMIEMANISQKSKILEPSCGTMAGDLTINSFKLLRVSL